MAILRSWFPRRRMDEVTRPVYRSDFNWTNHATHAKSLANYPDLFYWNVSRVLPKNPPVPDA